MYRQRCGGSSPFDGTIDFFLSPFAGLILFYDLTTHGSRPFDKLRASCGLHSFAASRLWRPASRGVRQEGRAMRHIRSKVKKAISG
jgi:hypothetical protein